ncbi:hypothetical protein [Lederbergia graminis]|uniref:Uncharacterized protein n=1 Tax=Lederbergia graminis TaxID=735518 RepID=A0ABW0LM25_9BACI
MDLIVTIGLIGVIGAVAAFLSYYLSSALNFEDAKRIDEVPKNDNTQE